METLEKVALFWDVDRTQLDQEQHADFIMRRVLHYGDVTDVQWATKRYGATRLASVVENARDLDARSRNFWNVHFVAHA